MEDVRAAGPLTMRADTSFGPSEQRGQKKEKEIKTLSLIAAAVVTCPSCF